MAGSNYVACNIAQSKSSAEQAQARNNIGAAGLSSLAASFDSRAPSYNWSAGEVCTYVGKLWQFDSDHNGALYIFDSAHAAGAWTGADAHEVTILEVLSTMSSSEKPTTILSAPIYVGGDPTDLNIYTYANNARTASVTFSDRCKLAFTPNAGADLDEVSFRTNKPLKIKRARIKTPGSIGIGAANGKKCATFYMETAWYDPLYTLLNQHFAMQFSAFNEWEDINLEVDAGANGFALPMYKLGIMTADSDSNPSTITIDDYNMQSAYEGQKLQAYLEIEVESEGLALA